MRLALPAEGLSPILLSRIRRWRAWRFSYSVQCQPCFRTAADKSTARHSLACSSGKTHIKQSVETHFQDLGPVMRNSTRDLPTSGYAIVVDGCVKTEFETKDGVEDGARDLKRRFPMLQVRVYDAGAIGPRNSRVLTS